MSLLDDIMARIQAIEARLSGTTSTSVPANYDQLVSQVQSLSATISNIQAQQQSNTNAIQSLNAQIQSLSNQMSSLSTSGGNLSGITSQLSSLQSQVNNIQAALSSLPSPSQISSLVSQQQQDVAAIQTLQSQLSSITSQIGNLSGITSQLSSLQSQINSLASQLSSFQSQLSSCCQTTTPPPSYGYNCASNGQCQYVQGGQYATLSQCQANCPTTTTTQYTLTFVPSGLPSTSTWAVNVNGTTNSGSGSQSISFKVAPGVYEYNITSPTGYTTNQTPGNVNVQQNQTVNISFYKSTTTQQNYSCVNGTCIPDQFGKYSSLANCQANCISTTQQRYACVNYTCVPSTAGPYSSLSDCQANCKISKVATKLSISSGLGGTVTPSGTYDISTLSLNTPITAKANSGYQFSNWTLNGTNIGSGASISLAQISNSLITGQTNTLVANFKQITSTGQRYTCQKTYGRFGIISANCVPSTNGEFATLSDCQANCKTSTTGIHPY